MEAQAYRARRPKLSPLWQCLDAQQAKLAMTELEVNFALLLQRLPDLPGFRFQGGAPFADSGTRDWIALHVSRHLQAPEAPRVAVDAEPWEIALQAVLPRLRKDGLKTAVHELNQGLHAARSDRVRFYWRLALARLCAYAGKHELAKIQLEQLDLELQCSGLERWEPELAFQVTHLLHRCCDLMPQNHAVRERKEDIVWFMQHFIEAFNRAHPEEARRIDPRTQEALTRYPWPGNVRELKHAVERACILSPGPVLGADAFFGEGQDVGAEAPASRPLADYLMDCERDYLRMVLDQHGGHMTHSAEALGITRKTLWEKMRRLGLQARDDA